MRKLGLILFALLCCKNIFASTVTVGSKTIFQIHMSPTGKDTNSGMSVNRPILTLNRAQELLSFYSPNHDVEVLIKPGTYYQQTVIWRYFKPEYKLSFKTSDPNRARPIFDGCDANGLNCVSSVFFTLKASSGKPTNLDFYYLLIQKYRGAIYLAGNREIETASNSGNRIYGCYFKDIGNFFNPSLEMAYGVIGLVNSKSNLIRNNHFHSNINTFAGAGAIHSVYLAHHSSHNSIINNAFYNISGDPIKFRDNSNRNLITGSRFQKAGASSIFQEWYCDSSVRNDCTKTSLECPSWGNIATNNTFGEGFACHSIPEISIYNRTQPGCVNNTSANYRIKSYDNLYAPKYCQQHSLTSTRGFHNLSHE